jgi:alpha-L-fucosidase
MLSKRDYEKQIAASRDKRMKWWRNARFGMFVHYGLHSVVGRHEWLQALEHVPVKEYEKLAKQFNPKPDAPREWAKLAKKAGMKYMVLTTRHHEGFSLWNSKANPYNSYNLCGQRDLVQEFVDACREFNLKIGFYSSLMDWHHPDGWECVNNRDARIRFNDYIEAINTELLTQYGKIDILWYDVAQPLRSWEAWNSVEMNQRLRKLQPGIIINNRSWLDEDFGTPEEKIKVENRDWEACMTFNGISWGYLDSEQALPYSYSPQQILMMLRECTEGGGNLLLNIGVMGDGSVPPEAIEPLTTVGKWLKKNGKAVYGKQDRIDGWHTGATKMSRQGNKVYAWVQIWPQGGKTCFAGWEAKLKSAKIFATGEKIEFTQKDTRILLTGLPSESPDPIANITLVELEFASKDPKNKLLGNNPQFKGNSLWS